MAWRIEFDRTAERELAKLDPQTARRILTFLNERLAPSTDPRRLGEALHGNLATYWKYRVGDYRIIATIEDRMLRILVVRIGNRRDVYR
jgi:mRNA interferase RelE/StbE